MSELVSNKRQKTEDNFRRNSFSDRVCEDLCELILQFLPLKDKFRFEGLSKQFQRTVFLKQTEFCEELTFESEEQLIKFEKMVQKLPNIRRLATSLSGLRQNMAYDLIGKYWPKITQLVSFVESNLVERFGPQLVSLDIPENNEMALNEINWQTMTNIEELVLSEFPPQFSAIKFNRLKRFEMKDVVDVDLLEAFLVLNTETITHLTLDYTFDDDYYYYNDDDDKEEEEVNENQVIKVKRILNITSKMANLVHFKLKTLLPLNDRRFGEELTQLALNCHQLKSLDIKYVLTAENGEQMEDLLSSLKQFKALKRLRLYFDETDKNFYFLSFKLFNGFEELSHLGLSFKHYGSTLEVISEKVLTEIDINLPKLQYLRLNGLAVECSQWTADILSRLSRLQTIEFKVQNESIIPHIKTRLLKNCRKIKTISIN